MLFHRRRNGDKQHGRGRFKAHRFLGLISNASMLNRFFGMTAPVVVEQQPQQVQQIVCSEEYHVVRHRQRTHVVGIYETAGCS